MACQKTIVFCNGSETCPECTDLIASPPSTVCDNSGLLGGSSGNDVAVCEAVDLWFCIPTDCVGQTVQLILERIGAPSSEAPYTDNQVSTSELIDFTVADDSLVPGWYRPTLRIPPGATQSLVITYVQTMRVIPCDETPEVPVCLVGNVPATVDPDATSFSCCP